MDYAVDWNKLNDDDLKAIHQVSKRATAILSSYGAKTNPFLIEMDLIAVHQNNPLDFNAMLKGRDFDLVHDVHGIIMNLNRETGNLENCFLPRYTK